MDERMLRGGVVGDSASGGGANGNNGKGDSVAPAALHAQALKLKGGLTYTRSDLMQLNNQSTNATANSHNNNNKSSNKSNNSNEAKQTWASDGLGGIFNGEGYTGRKDGGGHRVFKAHLMNKEGFGQSKDCPFDCDCCYI